MPVLRHAGILALSAAIAGGCASARRPGDAPAAPGAALAPREIVAARGETVCALAGRAGADVDALRKANRFAVPPERPLTAGRVTLPAGAVLRHRIRAGETLRTIARWYGHPLDVLAAANRIDDPDRIVAGTWLAIPAGARTGCPPPAPTLAKARARAVSPAAKPARARIPAAPAPEPEPRIAVPVEAKLPVEAAVYEQAALARVDAALAEASRRYDVADFEAVLALTARARSELPAGGQSAESIERRARASWLAGLANAGLDRREEAIAALREALTLRPSLRHDESLSPRILGLLEEPPAGGR
jgi:LysM repeat protein